MRCCSFSIHLLWTLCKASIVCPSAAKQPVKFVDVKFQVCKHWHVHKVKKCSTCCCGYHVLCVGSASLVANCCFSPTFVAPGVWTPLASGPLLTLYLYDCVTNNTAEIHRLCKVTTAVAQQFMLSSVKSSVLIPRKSPVFLLTCQGS